jgi:hypothetical protein
VTDEFARRLAAARDRALAKKAHAKKSAGAERETEEQRARRMRAIEQWHRRIAPLIKEVVQSANEQMRTSGTRLVVAEDFNRVACPYVDIFGTPEGNHDLVKRDTFAPHLRISVEANGDIARGILQGGVGKIPIRVLPRNFQRKQVEDAVADFVERTVGPIELAQ